MILNDVVEIRTIIEEFIDVNLNVQTSYKLMKFLQETENDYNFFINKSKEIVNKYAIKDENDQIINNNNGIQIDEIYADKLQSDLIELSLIEVNIGDYFLFHINELSGLNMSCRKMRPFIPYIVD